MTFLIYHDIGRQSFCCTGPYSLLFISAPCYSRNMLLSGRIHPHRLSTLSALQLNGRGSTQRMLRSGRSLLDEWLLFRHRRIRLQRWLHRYNVDFRSMLSKMQRRYPLRSPPRQSSSQHIFEPIANPIHNMIAAINSFSNLYHCAIVNGTSIGDWCCGAKEGTPEAGTGCCNNTLFYLDMGGALFNMPHTFNTSNATASPVTIPQAVLASNPTATTTRP